MSKSIRDMFDGIAGKYDFLNHFLSLGRDLAWRRQASQLLAPSQQLKALDLCGGTGDFLKALSKHPLNLKASSVGDFSFNMLRGCRKKFPDYRCSQLDALNLPFVPKSFDVVTCGYGMRNLDVLERGMEEVHRVLKSGGHFITLEFFKPDNMLTKTFYHVLAPLFIPFFGGFFSGKKSAYHYLVDSVKKFDSVDSYAEKLKARGFHNISIKACDGGISHIVMAQKI